MLQQSIINKGGGSAGMSQISDQQMAAAEKQGKVWDTMIQSITPKGRENVELLVFYSHYVSYRHESDN